MLLENPRIFFCESAWREVCEEASRWCQIGLREQKTPFESVAYPLMYVSPKKGHEKCPAEMLYLPDIDFAVATHVAIPDDHVKNYSSGSANFLKEGVDIDAYSDQFARKKISPLIGRFPLIEVVSRLHSHPFSKKACHSSGDLATIQKDGIGARKKGFGLSFSFIVKPKKRNLFSEWNIACFALAAGWEIPLAVERVPDDHPMAKRARRQPYYRRQKGRRWEKELELYIGKKFEGYQKKRKPRGWTSFWLKREETEAVLFIPPFFPEEVARIFVSEKGADFQEKSLPFVHGLFPGFENENILGIPLD